MITTKLQVKLSQAHRSVLPSLLEIERLSFSRDRQWTATDFDEELGRDDCVCMMATKTDGKIVGFIVYATTKSRHLLLNFAVHPDYRRQGVSTKLVEYLQRCVSHGRSRGIFCVVSEQDTGCHLMLKHCGFQATKVIEDYFSHDAHSEDAYEFVYGLD